MKRDDLFGQFRHLSHELSITFVILLCVSTAIAQPATGGPTIGEGRSIPSDVQPSDVVNTLRSPFLPTDLNDVTVWRLEVLFHTCNRTYAATDDTVYVQFRNDPHSRFFLDYGRDDFKRNATDTFDVNPRMAGITTLRDVETFTIGKVRYAASATNTTVGTDAWCFDRVTIRINQSPELIFENSIANGYWLDGDDGYKPTKAFPRAEFKPTDTNVGVTPVIVISAAALESIVEGTVGHINITNDLYWGNMYGWKWVELGAFGYPCFDLDLALDSFWVDPEVDVDSCLSFGGAIDAPTLETRGTTVTDGEEAHSYTLAETFFLNSYRVAQYKNTFVRTWMTFPPMRSARSTSASNCVRESTPSDPSGTVSIVMDYRNCLN